MKQSRRLCASRSLSPGLRSPGRGNRTCRAAQRLSAAPRPGPARCHASGHRRYGSAAQAAYRQRRPGHPPHSTQRPHRRDRRTGDRCGRLHRQAVPGQGDRCPDQRLRPHQPATVTHTPCTTGPARRTVRSRSSWARCASTAAQARPVAAADLPAGVPLFRCSAHFCCAAVLLCCCWNVKPVVAAARSPRRLRTARDRHRSLRPLPRPSRRP